MSTRIGISLKAVIDTAVVTVKSAKSVGSELKCITVWDEAYSRLKWINVLRFSSSRWWKFRALLGRPLSEH